MAKQPNGYIRQITKRDKKLLVQLAKTGMATVEQSEKYAEVKIKRLKRLERSKYIKLTTLINGGKETTIIQLNKKGKNYIRETLMYDQKLAVASPDHVSHDIQLAETYYRLEPEFQATFICEHELISQIYEDKPYLTNKLETCIDAAIITVTGETIGIEVIGKTYTQSDINSKIQIAKSHLNCTKINWINNTGKIFKY
ncbi:hypothetical protein JYG23_12190 [Sedimentibacter sp. zth1]|uniref:hypothetical protein n=1 Tax=Sedimentibacter sp. zth1 TaxID=2816908 RepID=UPI001A931BA3|nr:hypothetical protein [Sedimentibacter sp. zth1]QSX05428.1 hypothetical protein JYG23_12190 [Sedimentibacter sp. zth1]